MSMLKLFVVSLAATFALAAIHGVAWSAKAKDADQHAAENVKPGSHEDWCDEHDVPESQCTQCNAALIPAYKATNDWSRTTGCRSPTAASSTPT